MTREAARTKRGKVYLIGAGPGDPELLTLKAVRMLGCADVVLIDDLVTAHTRASGGPNWAALAMSATTLVIYMGAARLAQIAAELIAAGMPECTPAAIVQHATLPQQASVVAPLRDIAAAARDAAIGSPAVIVIGDVVRYAAASVPLAVARAA